MGHRLTAILVLVLSLADIKGIVGFAVALTTDVVTRETIRPLPRKQARAGKRDGMNLTGANCAATCGGVAGMGPNQADCNQIIDALNARNTATFTMEPYSVASWVQASCTIEFIQSTADMVTYTYLYLGDVASRLSSTCNTANGYAEGRCIFDGREDAIWVGNTAVSDWST